MNELQWYQRLHWRGFVFFLLALALVSVPIWLVTLGFEQVAHRREVQRALGVSTLGALVAGAIVVIGARRWLRRRLDDSRRAIEDAMTGEAPSPVTDEDDRTELTEEVARVARDVHQKFEELDRERGRLAALLEGMGEAVVMTDERERVLVANPVAEQLLLLADDYSGRRLAEVSRIPRLDDIVSNVLWSGEDLSEEVELPRGENVLHVSISAAPIVDEDGASRGVVLVLYDVTRLRRLERVRRDFVANVSHELRTPIASIKSAAETLLLQDLDVDSEERRFVDTIVRNADRMASLVDDLLILSRLEAAGERLELGPVNLTSVFADVVDRASSLARRADVQLDIDLDEDLAEVRGEAGAITQILNNLVENAIKYTPPSGRVHLVAEKSAEEAVIRVSDTGVGIPTEHVPRIFERFYRVDVGRSREVGGTGLGLAIVKHLVRKLDGRIDVESAEGEGTSFTIHLRLADTTSDVDEPTAEGQV